MELDNDVLDILACPATKQPVSVADSSLIDRLNEAVERGELKNVIDVVVSERMEGGLLRLDRKVLYPVRENIPVLLSDEGIPVEPFL
jgi:uncharacterized protein YbaR (Trm112 family)